MPIPKVMPHSITLTHTMRTYPDNSPQAAARIVAMAMLADGKLRRDELLMLDYLRAGEQLGLLPHQLDAVVMDFCEDLRISANCGGTEAGLPDSRTMEELMSGIDKPVLQRKIVRLCVAAVEADGRVHEGESRVLGAAVEHWGLHREMLKAPPSVRCADHG